MSPVLKPLILLLGCAESVMFTVRPKNFKSSRPQSSSQWILVRWLAIFGLDHCWIIDKKKKNLTCTTQSDWYSNIYIQRPYLSLMHHTNLTVCTNIHTINLKRWLVSNQREQETGLSWSLKMATAWHRGAPTKNPFFWVHSLLSVYSCTRCTNTHTAS